MVRCGRLRQVDTSYRIVPWTGPQIRNGIADRQRTEITEIRASLLNDTDWTGFSDWIYRCHGNVIVDGRTDSQVCIKWASRSAVHQLVKYCRLSCMRIKSLMCERRVQELGMSSLDIPTNWRQPRGRPRETWQRTIMLDSDYAIVTVNIWNLVYIQPTEKHQITLYGPAKKGSRNSNAHGVSAPPNDDYDDKRLRYGAIACKKSSGYARLYGQTCCNWITPYPWNNGLWIQFLFSSIRLRFGLVVRTGRNEINQNKRTCALIGNVVQNFL